MAPLHHGRFPVELPPPPLHQHPTFTPSPVAPAVHHAPCQPAPGHDVHHRCGHGHIAPNLLASCPGVPVGLTVYEYVPVWLPVYVSVPVPVLVVVPPPRLEPAAHAPTAEEPPPPPAPASSWVPTKLGTPPTRPRARSAPPAPPKLALSRDRDAAGRARTRISIKGRRRRKLGPIPLVVVVSGCQPGTALAMACL